MGWDYEDAENDYWSSRFSSFDPSVRRAIKAEHAANVARAKGDGYTDEEILAFEKWPWEMTARERVEQLKRANLAREMKARTSPIGEPGSLLTRAAREAKEAYEIKDSEMISRERTIKNLKATIEEAQKELALLERMPAEPSETITTVTVTFPGSRKPYVYVGLRVDGEWKMSGKHFEGSNWTWQGIFNRFDQIHATVNYISTPTEYRTEQVF